MIDLQQQTPEWFEFRKTKIGASEASIILGINPWKTARQLMEEKLGLKEPQPTNQYMQRGIDLEPKARKCFIEMTEIEVNPAVLVHSKYEWMMASFDGLSKHKLIAVEIKCNGSKNHEMARNGEIPDYYYCQMQHQMAVADLNEMYYFSFDGEEGIKFIVNRDDEYIEKLIEREKEFYQMMMDYELPPETYKKKDDDAWLNAAKQLKETRSQIKFLQSLEEMIEKDLIEQSNGCDTMGGGIKLSQEIRKGSVDYKNIHELKDIDLDEYRKPSTRYWKITIDK